MQNPPSTIIAALCTNLSNSLISNLTVYNVIIIITTPTAPITAATSDSLNPSTVKPFPATGNSRTNLNLHLVGLQRRASPHHPYDSSLTQGRDVIAQAQSGNSYIFYRHAAVTYTQGDDDDARTHTTSTHTHTHMTTCAHAHSDDDTRARRRRIADAVHAHTRRRRVDNIVNSTPRTHTHRQRQHAHTHPRFSRALTQGDESDNNDACTHTRRDDDDTIDARTRGDDDDTADAHTRGDDDDTVDAHTRGLEQ